ncbi:MAG: ImmA/IrrE family metallo-endopeptidase [Chloroflexi bacterium]|nr:ImmA/IrrE family metallo-endopeptidase [Chloroflexota bacterium]
MTRARLQGGATGRKITLNSTVTDTRWLAYTFAHEVGHAILRHPEQMMYGQLEEAVAEQQANWMAA